jgi:proline iminopeptidase
VNNRSCRAFVAAFVFLHSRGLPRLFHFQEISKMPYLAVGDGVRLFYRTIGNGADTLVIPNGMYLIDELRRFADRRTLIFYDLRNRGLSETSKNTRGIHQDVDDLDAVRQHFGARQISVLGHSYVGMTVALYAMKYPDLVNRVIQIGPIPPSAAKQYPAHLKNEDATLKDVLLRLAELQKEPASDPQKRCERFWSVLREIYVADPANAAKIDWGRCELANERNFMRYFAEDILPSIQKLELTAEEVAKVKAPVLIIHGTRDRSSPYGGAMDWLRMFPDARLVPVENAAHAPWIEAPDTVVGAIESFLTPEARK